MKFLVKVFCLFLLWGIVFSFPAAGRSSVVFSGISPELEKKTDQNFSNFFDLNHQITPSEIDDVIRFLMENGTFKQVQAYRLRDGRILLEAISQNVIGEIVFQENRRFSRDILTDNLGLKEGERYDKKSLDEATQRLKSYYQDQGMLNADVHIKINPMSNGSSQIVVVIYEGSPCLITHIEIETVNGLLKNRLEYRLNRLARVPISTATLSNIKTTINNYLSDHNYLSTSLSEPDILFDRQKKSAVIKYSLGDPFQYDRRFVGYHQLSLFDIYRAIPSDSERSSSVDPVREIVDQIKSKYNSQGFVHVQVNAVILEDKKKFLRKIIFTIVEGPQVKLGAFELVGRISRNAQYYINYIKNNSSPLIEKGYFNRHDLEKGMQNLVVELRNQGFLKARIQSVRTEFVKNKAEARVHVTMDEGALTQIRRIEFNGMKAFSELELSEAISIKSNTPLQLLSVEESLNQLKNFYHNRGYLEMRIKNENDQLITYNEKGTEAQIQFHIYEGPKIYVAAIKVEGNSFTQENVVLREIDFKVGDILTPEKLEESQVRLNKTGIFSQVHMRTLEDGTPLSQRTVVISIKERDPGLFKVGVGADSERNLTLRQFTSLSYNNILGTARGLSGRLEFGYNPEQVKYLTFRLTAGYLEPFLFESRTRGRLNFTRQQEIIDFEESSELTQIQDSSRVDFLLERDLTRSLKLTWALWSLDSIRTFERRGYCMNGSGDKCPDQLDRIALIGPTIDYDLRDSPFVPTRGSHVRWNLGYSDPQLGSSTDVKFIKTEISYSYLWNLGSPQLVWANQLRRGYLSNLSSESGSKIPPSQLFFLGGTSTLRGFGGSSSNERIPQGADFPNGEVEVKDTSDYTLVKSEFRFPLYDIFGGVIFYDGGQVNVRGYHFPLSYRDSAGFGLRVNTPVGPVTLDMGFKLNTVSGRGEDPWRLHFSIGSF